MDSIIFGLLNKLNRKIDGVGSVPDEKITEAVNNYLDENPVTPGATPEQAAQIQKNTDDISQLSEEKVENPLTGVVGQILEIETVDESGKPKTYKAVNKPSGGGEVTDEQISNAVDNYMTAHPFTETDPAVPDWAKQPEKPTYTASEVGALPVGTKIPSKTSDLQNDSGFLTEHQDLSYYALKSEVPKSASDVGADASGTAESKVSEHNISDTSHNDIRLLVQGLTTRLNALADSDDTTLDQMSEVVAYIKSNKSLIDAITTSKVNVSDIIDNLITNVSNKPLSAAQGVVLKAMIDGITIPTTLPNPNALTFTGAVTGSYDGSSPIEINIPGGGGTDVAVDTTLSVAGQAADAKATGDAISSLSEEIADKVTLENGVIKFWKTSTEESGTDTLLYSVDISSIGGTGGLDLENLTLSVSQVGNYQRLSMSDGTTIKTVDIPITVITNEQVQTAVTEYLNANPVQAGVSASYDGNGTIVFGNSSNTQSTQYENGDEVSY